MVLRHAVDKPNRWAFRCRANVNGERVAVHRAAGKLFQMIGPATVKLLMPSVVLVLGTDSVPVPADRGCRLPAMAEIARQSSAKYVDTSDEKSSIFCLITSRSRSKLDYFGFYTISTLNRKLVNEQNELCELFSFVAQEEINVLLILSMLLLCYLLLGSFCRVILCL